LSTIPITTPSVGSPAAAKVTKPSVSRRTTSPSVTVTEFAALNTNGAGLAIAIADTFARSEGLVVVVVPDFVTAFRLERELTFFDVPLVHFPDWETLPYDTFSPHQDIISQRLAALHLLPTFSKGILIIPIGIPWKIRWINVLRTA